MPDNQKPGDIMIPGEHIYLGQIQKELTGVYRTWLNNLEISRTLGIINDVGLPLTDQDEEEWLDMVRKDNNQTMFTIYERPDGRAIGNTGLSGIRSHNRSAEFGLIIGDPAAHGKGYGTEATRLILDYGFTMLGLHHIWLRCVEFNHAGIRAYQKAGFTEVGRFREAWHAAGQQHDVVLMDILASEFKSPVLQDLLEFPDRD